MDNEFWSHVDRSGDCWLWIGAERGGKTGYERYGGWRNQYAHRYAYEQVIGPIPDGMGLDHRPTCSKRCVKPTHLRPTTQSQNMQNLTGPHRDSTSGVRGVSWDAQTGRWRAQMCLNYVHYRLGRFATVAEAETAVIAKRLELFTHNDLDRISA
jgi:hypothetical protein